jgi:hypothetical protein
MAPAIEKSGASEIRSTDKRHTAGVLRVVRQQSNGRSIRSTVHSYMTDAPPDERGSG